jgi:hypothetical protein
MQTSLVLFISHVFPNVHKMEKKHTKIWKATMFRARALALKAKTHSEHVVVNLQENGYLGD